MGQYESIYDPTHLGGADQIHQAQGLKNEGDSIQIETGPGAGRLEGSVPYDRVVGEYQRQAAQAMDENDLSQNLRHWVTQYFDALVE